MFQNLRQNSQLYIFHKGDKPYLETGYVTSISPAKPKYGLPATFGQPQELVVDVIAKINGSVVNYNSLPANLDLADTFSNNENIVITDNKEAMNNEILSAKQKSIDIVNSVEFHKQMISSYDSILNELNPEYAEKQQQQIEINILKTQMNDVSAALSSLTQMIKELKEEKK